MVEQVVQAMIDAPTDHHVASAACHTLLNLGKSRLRALPVSVRSSVVSAANGVLRHIRKGTDASHAYYETINGLDLYPYEKMCTGLLNIFVLPSGSRYTW